ncbi:Hypothetical predicted protein [Pelobates cultripes]|uniref:Uncharacterized protein n=1 Tax=Pelobates cultripes TaxID=61616 RepID=A0AAD1W7T2_PELCU|nr:Hypothetical predicted protein [Pelobates cultripes]
MPLLTKLFSAKQAKAMTLAGWHRITGPATGIQRPTRDIILRFQQGQDRTAFMAAVRHITPLRFEDHDLTFYPDLSKATMEWRRSLRPLTQALAASKTPYKWGSPRCLLITRETGIVKVREASEIPSILLQMGVTRQPLRPRPKRHRHSGTQRGSHHSYQRPTEGILHLSRGTENLPADYKPHRT